MAATRDASFDFDATEVIISRHLEKYYSSPIRQDFGQRGHRGRRESVNPPECGRTNIRRKPDAISIRFSLGLRYRGVSD
jgi:hypothetical protein